MATGTVMSQPVSINYGPEYRRTLAATLGVADNALSDLRVVASSPYVTPHYKVYALPDGRYARVLNQAASDLVTLYDNWVEWHEAENARWAAYPDPDTGRMQR